MYNISNKIAANNGIIESRGLFHDPGINASVFGGGSDTKVAVEISNEVALNSGVFEYFDAFFYFIYMILRIPLDIIGWFFGFNVAGNFSDFFDSLLTGNGLLGYLGYFLENSPVSKLFGNGIGKDGGYSLIPDTMNPFVIIKNFFYNPFGGPSFFELFFMGFSIFWWIISFLLIWFLFFWRKKMSELKKKDVEKYDSVEEYADIKIFRDDQKKKRWSEIVELINSDDIYDWRESIFLADILLDDVFKSHNLKGNLKEIFSKIHMESSDKIIDVKDFAKEIKYINDDELTKKIIKEKLDDYNIIFKELYYM